MAQSVLDYLVGYLPMNETGFARFDVSGNGYNFVAPYNVNLSYGTGKVSNALKFDGTGYLVNQSPLEANTVAFWIYPTGNGQIFTDNRENIGQTPSFLFIDSTSLKIRVSDGDNSEVRTLGTITLNAWNFVIYSFAGNAASAIINNGARNNVTYGEFDGNCFNKIGGEISANTLLDEVAFYNFPADILDRDLAGLSSYLYNSGNARTYPFVNKWFYSASSTNLSTVGNWWNNSTHTTPAGSVPTTSDVIQIDSPAASGTANARDAVIPNTFSGTAYIGAVTGAAVFNNINSAISGGQIDCNGAYVVYPAVQANINTDYISFGSGVNYVNYSNNANNIYYWQKGTFDLNTGGWTSDPGGLYSTSLPASTNNIYLNGYYTGTLANGYPVVNVYNLITFDQDYTGTINLYNFVSLSGQISGTANLRQSSIQSGNFIGNINFYDQSVQAGNIQGNANYYSSQVSIIGGIIGGSLFYNSFSFLDIDPTLAVFGGVTKFTITSSEDEANNWIANFITPIETGFQNNDIITVFGCENPNFDGTWTITVDPNNSKSITYALPSDPGTNGGDARAYRKLASSNLYFYDTSSYGATAVNFDGNFYFGGNSRVSTYIPPNRLFYTSMQAYANNNAAHPGTFIAPKKAISLSQLLHLPFPINI